MPHKHIGPVLSQTQRSLRRIQAKKRPKKRKKESYDHYIGRVGVWLAGQKKKVPVKKVKTERQRRIEQRKKAEKMLGIKRGIKKKKKVKKK